MGWNEQEKRALEILKDPGAEEQQWLDACNEIGSRKTVPHSALLGTLYWPIALATSFCSGIASVVGGTISGCAVVIGIYLFTVSFWAHPLAALSPLLFVIGLSMILGFTFGLCRRTPLEHEGLRLGLITPILGATVLANIFSLGGLLAIMGTWAYNIPILSVFITLGTFKLGSNLLNQLLTEQERGQQPMISEHSIAPEVTHQRISLAKSSTESHSQKSDTNSDQIRIDTETLESEKLHIEREKIKIEREKLELEREKLQIKMERMRHNAKPQKRNND